MPRTATTIIYDEASGSITANYLRQVGQDGKTPRLAGLIAEAGEGLSLIHI